MPLKFHHLIMFGQRIKQRKKWKWEKAKKGAWSCNPLQWFWIARFYVFSICKKKIKVVFEHILFKIQYQKFSEKKQWKWNKSGICHRDSAKDAEALAWLRFYNFFALSYYIFFLSFFSTLCGQLSQFWLEYWTCGPSKFCRYPK